MGKKAAILVDLQMDFTEVCKGSLPVPGTDFEYVDEMNYALQKLMDDGIPIIASMDWHPEDHMSFKENGGIWPRHCVQNTNGAELVILNGFIGKFYQIFKGMDPKYDSYSAFKDDGGKGTGLLDYLLTNEITDLIIFGLATDYCVKATVLDAIKNHFNVEFVKNLSKGVAKETTHAAIEEMREAGAKISIYAD